ncbi:MAG: hypothetical protein KDK25_08685 [Leptospiraceae bacterium]|nr:hypothetical protein [Leptospiraceae bacterium]
MNRACPPHRAVVGFLALVLVGCSLVGCSAKSPSFSETGLHPLSKESDFAPVTLEVQATDFSGPVGPAYRIRVVGYDGPGIVAASIVGPYFDAEESPSKVRPIFLADGYFRSRSRYRIELPANGGSLYIRLFRVIEEESWLFGEKEQETDEFIAIHLRLNSRQFTIEGNPIKPYCEATFWKIRNPVRRIVHCYLPSPRELKDISLEISEAAGKEGEPEVRIPRWNLKVQE